MFKVLPVLFLATFVWINAVICEDCLFTDQTWGNINPTKIVYCDLKTNEPQEAFCRTGYGFKSNDTVSGCVPWEEWNAECIMRNNVPTIDSCEGVNTVSPQPVHGDPTSYYLCSSSSSKPSVLYCPENRGFISFEGYLGCIPWKPWRNITGCTV